MARKTNLQLQQELAEVKAALATAEAAKAEADRGRAEDRAALRDQSLHVTEGSDTFGGEIAHDLDAEAADAVFRDADLELVREGGTEVREANNAGTPEWARDLFVMLQEQKDEIEELKLRKPKRQKTPVGERDGDVTIRNITSRLVRIRLGKPSDPYRIELQPRGRSGDVADVPGSLTGTTQYKRNIGRVFEVVTSDEAAAIDYTGTGAGRQFPVAPLIQEAERIISRQEIDPRTGLPTGQRERGGPVGPRVLAAPGSDQSMTGVPEGVDPEYAQFLAWKSSQGTLGAPMAGTGPYEPGSQAGVSLLTRLDQAAQSGDQEAAGMARKLRAAAAKGVIPEGELDKPIRVTRSQVSVQPNVIY